MFCNVLVIWYRGRLHLDKVTELERVFIRKTVHFHKEPDVVRVVKILCRNNR